MFLLVENRLRDYAFLAGSIYASTDVTWRVPNCSTSRHTKGDKSKPTACRFSVDEFPKTPSFIPNLEFVRVVAMAVPKYAFPDAENQRKGRTDLS